MEKGLLVASGLLLLGNQAAAQAHDISLSVTPGAIHTLFISRNEGTALSQPVFKICNSRVSPSVIQLHISGDPTTRGPSHPLVGRTSLDPGECVFASGGQIDALVIETVAPRAEPLAASIVSATLVAP